MVSDIVLSLHCAEGRCLQHEENEHGMPLRTGMAFGMLSLSHEGVMPSTIEALTDTLTYTLSFNTFHFMYKILGVEPRNRLLMVLTQSAAFRGIPQMKLTVGPKKDLKINENKS